MKRKLLKQMRREWGGNFWLVLELIIVGTVIWTITSMLAPMMRRGAQPLGLDISDVYMARIETKPENSPTYVAYDSLNHTQQSEVSRLLTNLRSNPYVELAGRGEGASPYSYNYNGSWLIDIAATQDSAKFIATQVNVRRMTPETLRILRLQGARGETTGQLAQALERGDVILSTTDELPDGVVAPDRMLGKDVYFYPDSSHIVRTAAVMSSPVPRDDYEPRYNADAIAPLQPDELGELYVRLKPGTGQEFIESLTADQTSAGNIYVSTWKSLERQREIVGSVQANLRRNQIMLSVFLLAVVFMGFLGTFWFRTQQRVGEIAMRKVCGATDSQIFRRMLSEACTLLAIAAVPTALLCCLIHDKLLVKDGNIERIKAMFYGYHEWGIWTASIGTLLLMLLIIVAAIWYPARKAMKVDPASALKDL